MKKKSIVFFLILIIVILGYIKKDELKMAFAPIPVSIEGEAAVVVDGTTGEIIFAKNEHQKLYPASTTKLLTAIVVLDRSLPDEKVTVGEEVYLQTEGESRAGLFEGQVQSVEAFLSAMLLQSGNDAARSLAVYIAEKENNRELTSLEAINYFAKLMNEKALEIGATESHFVNPHGLHDSNHYSSATDLMIIAKAAKENEVISNIVNQESYSTKTHTYTNRNQLLNPNSPYYYENATGLKTGFTDEAGYCLISSAEKKGQSLIAVVLRSGKETVWEDSINLLNYGFQNIN